MSDNLEARWAALSAQLPPSFPHDEVDSDDGVRVGQLRSATWGEQDAIVLIVGVDEARAEAVANPVSLEPGVADERAIVLEGDRSPLRGAVTIWPEVNATLSFVVLHDTVAVLTTDAFAAIADGAVRNTNRGGDGARLSRTPLPGSGAALAIDDLMDSIHELASVRPCPRRASQPGREAKIPLSLSELIEALGITQSVAMSVLKGRSALTSEQAEIVARAANVPVTQVLSAARALPEALERELMEPRWRAAVRRRATAGDEASTREELGRQAFALAARSTGDGREMWRQRIRTVLEAETR